MSTSGKALDESGLALGTGADAPDSDGNKLSIARIDVDGDHMLIVSKFG